MKPRFKTHISPEGDPRLVWQTNEFDVYHWNIGSGDLLILYGEGIDHRTLYPGEVPKIQQYMNLSLFEKLVAIEDKSSFPPPWRNR